MIHLKSAREVEKIRASCRIAAEAMAAVVPNVRPGVSTSRLDEVADAYIRSKGGIPSAKGYRGYPKSICISVNEEVVHGIPGDYVVQPDDLVKIDVTAELDGYMADAAITVAVPPVAPRHRDLCRCAETALRRAVR